MPVPPYRALRVFSVLLVLAGCICAGCTAPAGSAGTSQTQNRTDFGFRPDADYGGGQGIRFAEAASSFDDLLPGADNRSATNTTPTNRILSVHGIGLNADGDAAGWIFIVSSSNRTYIVTADSRGTTVADWKGASPRGEIRLGSILPPAELFRMNRPLILGYAPDNRTVSRDLVLSMNTYTLTVSGGGERRVLVFDAGTGAPVKTGG